MLSVKVAKISPVSRRGGDLRRGILSELALFRKPKVALSVLALIFVPSLYVLIYVSSVWDPYGSFSQLPVALANEDIPAVRFGREINLGAKIVETLEQERSFGFVRYETAESAREDVRSGKVLFALLIPPDFSERAAASNQPAQLGLYVSEGSNYTGALVAKRFGSELAHQLNQRLNHERWATLVGEVENPSATRPTLARGLAGLQAGGRQVLAGSTRLHDGSSELTEGVARAANAAEKFAKGSAELESGSVRLTGGLRSVGEAVTEIRLKLPNDATLQELTMGSAALTAGTAELVEGLDQLQAGAARLETGTGDLQAGVQKAALSGKKLTAGTAQLHSGASTLARGIDQAVAGANRVNDGMLQLNSHLQPLSLGLVDLNAGLRTLSERLPSSDQLELFDRSIVRVVEGSEALSAGLKQLREGAARLQLGASELQEGAGRLSAGLDEALARVESGFGGASASHLAASVETVTEVVAPVPQNGPAFAPYFAALSLWIGAVMMSFVFHLRRLPDSMRQASRATRWLTKAMPLLAVGVLQATVVVGVLEWGLGVSLANPVAVWSVAALGSVTFVTLIVLLITALGDAGRLLAVILLIFQLAASGGIYPIELSPEFYHYAHGYLPFTFLVHSFRATLFSAFDGNWQPDAIRLGIVAGGAVMAGVFLARWKYVAPESYGPAVDF
jgi:putative membrane protein